MSDFLTPNSMIMLQQAMSFQWAKQRAISDNIVNAETPNYKVKYVTFEEALRKNIQAAAQDRNAAPSAMRQTLEAAAPQVRGAGDERACRPPDRRSMWPMTSPPVWTKTASMFPSSPWSWCGTPIRSSTSTGPSAATCPGCSWRSEASKRQSGTDRYGRQNGRRKA